MILEILIVVLIGCFAGTITGLTPGLHINLVSLIMLGISPFLLGYTNVIAISAFIISMSITHTFTDFISATYLGAPGEDTALAVMPAHRLLMKGMGHEAVRLTVIGSLACLLATIALSPLLVFVVPLVFKQLKNYIPWILIFIILIIILREDSAHKKFWAAIVAALSSILGMIVLNIPNLKDPLLPMLGGLFGISVLALSLSKMTRLPIQRDTEHVQIRGKDLAKSIGSGIFSGSLVSIFPGLGPAQAAVLASQFVKKTEQYAYLILVGGINTVSMVLSLVTLFTIEKARNGSIIVVQQLLQNIDKNTFALFMAVALIAGGIATFLTLYVSKIFSKMINKINYPFLNMLIITFVSALVLYFTGWIGILILLIATFIGLIANLIDVSRSNLMACLIVPIVLMNLV